MNGVPGVSGATGVLVDPAGADAFARAVDSVLGNPEWAGRLASAAAARARRYTWWRAAQELRATYDALADRRLVACR